MIYLDNAATSFPKPPSVILEQERCMRAYCGNPGRSSHPLALVAAEKVYECREALAALFGSRHPERVVFTLNCTAALNTVLKGLLSPGDHVLISDMEHNAVLRPLHRLAEAGVITYDVYPTFPLSPERTSEDILRAVAARIRPNTRLLVAAHASNICSATLPLYELGAFCRARGILFAVDAAQSAGHLPIDMEGMKIDALCAPGHKGLLGPQGTGFFILGEGIDPTPLTEGGSGSDSLDPHMPKEPPERYEAGTLQTPAIAGLLAGVQEITRIGIDTIHAHECAMVARLEEQLSAIPTITVKAPSHRGSVLLFHSTLLPASHIGTELSLRGICVRTGFHCTALAHTTLGTPPAGAVRVSPGLYTSPAQIDALTAALKQLIM